MSDLGERLDAVMTEGVFEQASFLLYRHQMKIMSKTITMETETHMRPKFSRERIRLIYIR